MSTKIEKRIHIKAPFARVVAKIAGFSSLAEWHPAFETCEVDGEAEGAIRTAKLGDLLVKDRLDEVDPARGYRYTQLEGPLTFTNYRAYLWVTDEGAAGSSVEWTAKVSGSTFPSAAVAAMLEGIFEMGLTAAKIAIEQEHAADQASA